MTYRQPFVIGILCLCVLAAACAPAPTATPPPSPTPRDDTPYREALTAGPHGDTYSLNTGPNTYCARCKSPANWDPDATIGQPPNCVTCKFPGSKEMFVAEGNPLVQEHDWEGIRCYHCHPKTEGESVEAEIAWWDPASGAYETAADSTALCEQCHNDTSAGTMRKRALEDSEAHADFTCTSCHDPHSAEAACSACHNQADTETAFVEVCWEPYLAPGAPAHHTDMLCVTCHDNAGLEPRPVEDSEEPYTGQWATWRSMMIAGIIPSEHVWVSHNLTGEVECARCHYVDNPWNLDVEVERP